MVSLWSLSDSKSPQVSRILLANLDNTVIWMVSTCPLISKFSSFFTNPLRITPSAPTTNVITVTLFHILSSIARSRYLSLFPLSFIFTHWSAGTAKSTIWQPLGLVVWPGLGDPFVFQNTREDGESHSPGRILGSAYTTCLL